MKLSAEWLINLLHSRNSMSVTLYDKLWNEHLVQTDDTNESLIYIDRHYLHEVTSPQAFEGLRHKKLKPWLMEVNVCPSLGGSTPLDRKVKSTMICDVLNLIGFTPFNKSKM